MAVAADLRPRSAVELYDAAIHLCTRGGTAAPALALLGAAPVAVAGLTLYYQAALGRPMGLTALALTVALFFRFVCLGAAALAVDDALSGTESSARGCLGRAARAAPPLCIAGTVDLACRWIGHPITFGLGFFLWSGLWAAPSVAMAGDRSPWRVGAAVRERLGGRSAAAMGVRGFHLAAFLLVAVNLWLFVIVALFLGRAFFGLDVTFAMRFCSPDNGLFVLALVCGTLTLLEPVRAVLGPLLLADARVRRDGFDLRDALARLADARPGSAAAAAVLAALLAAPPGLAQPAVDDVGSDEASVEQTEAPDDESAPRDRTTAGRAALPLIDRLALLAEDLRVAHRRDVRDELERVAHLGVEDQAALRRFVDRMEARLDADDEGLGTDFLAGLSEAARVPRAAAPARDPRAMAREILERPEFVPTPDRVRPPSPKDEAPSEPPSWLQRILDWIWRALRRLFDDAAGSAAAPALPGLSAGFFRVAVYLLVGVAVALLLWLLFGLLGRGEAATEAAADATAAAAGPAPAGESALAKPPRAWWELADDRARRGDHRGAIRFVYLALLAALHARGDIDYDPTRSNWDYCRAFRGGDPERGALCDLTGRFDFAWYGRLGATSEGYERFRTLARPLVAAASAEA